MKNLPLGIQTFRKLIEGNYLYIDKTKDIYNLFLGQETYYFLSRPRRFGKSLLVTTLKEIFLGNQELFKGLWIYNKIEWKEYPIIHLDFSDMTLSSPDNLIKSIELQIKKIAIEYNISFNQSFDYRSMFKELIDNLSKINKVVILIDEYDKPIVEFVDNMEIASEMRNILKEFYTTMKASDKNIRFAFLTGVSKFAKVSVFSGLNNLRDITLSGKFSTILGYTQNELIHYFNNRMENLANDLNISHKRLLQEIKKWYNGYSWDAENFVYNPFSILNLFTENKISNYWFISGTPSFLIKLIKQNNIPIEDIDNYETGSDIFDSYDIDRIQFQSLLFQTGYLTIKKIKEIDIGVNEYLLSFPNQEVKESLLKYILADFSQSFESTEIMVNKMARSLLENNPEEFFVILKSLFASIPSNLFIADKEAYYHSIIYLVLTLLGVRISAEVHTNRGRIDATIESEKNIYIMEFKLGTAKKALQQIESKQYHEKYLSSGKSVILIGIGFSIKERNLKNYLIKQIYSH